MVPDGWAEGRVSDLLNGLESGVSVNGEDRDLSVNEKAVLKVSAVSYGYFDPLAAKAIGGDELSRAKTNPKKGQIIISRSNTEELVGASAFIERDYPNLFLPDKLWQTMPKKSSDMKWLSYVLTSAHARYTLSNLATGTSGSMKNITKGTLLGLKILIPPPSEQKKIAQILSTWDKAITTTEKLLANSQQQKKALMQQLLTGKKRLLHGKGWKNYKFDSLFRERVEVGRDDLPLLSITAEDGVVYQEDSGRKNTSNEDKSKYRRICPNDIGYNTMRMWQGRSSLSDKEGIVSPAYTIVSPTNKVVPSFAAYLFKLPALIHIFYRRSQGLVSDTWNLKFNHFKKINWSLPCVEEQQKIATALSIADQEITALQQKVTALKQEKKSLMQQLLAGKRRVKIEGGA